MKNLKEMFDKLNEESLRYVVMRNWDSLPYGCFSIHDDIDILTDDSESFIKTISAKKIHPQNFRVQYSVDLLSGRQLIDVRNIDDGYYPQKWAEEVLENRKYDKNRGIYIPDDYNATMMLIYHVLFHKKHISKDYIPKIKAGIGNIFSVSKPNDLSVNFDEVDLGYGENVISTGVTSFVSIVRNGEVKKSYFKEYSHCLESEVSSLKKLSDCDHFPNIIDSDNLSLTMNYCGERLGPHNLPEDWQLQMKSILTALQKEGIAHRDITPLNLLYDKFLNKIVLIDFGWSTTLESKEDLRMLSKEESESLGLLWKHPEEFNDAYSLEKVLSEIYFQKLGIQPPKALFSS